MPKVLLIDDEEPIRKVVGLYLRSHGYEVITAEDGQRRIELFQRESPPTVLTDIKMPGMDGIEVLHHIKKRYPKTEVIFLTGHAATQDGVHGIKTGAFDYLSKPIEFEHMPSKIKQDYEKVEREEEKRREAEFRNKMEQKMATTERLDYLETLAAGVAKEINNT